jgi:hypothetical protein
MSEQKKSQPIALKAYTDFVKQYKIDFMAKNNGNSPSREDITAAYHLMKDMVLPYSDFIKSHDFKAKFGAEELKKIRDEKKVLLADKKKAKEEKLLKKVGEIGKKKEKKEKVAKVEEVKKEEEKVMPITNFCQYAEALKDL